ncbi:MAG: tandem-95 repeat protein, partial [Planctomycetales bacterium]|nr:tandem-95 repeat protein [Planctomycetales bacterium]
MNYKRRSVFQQLRRSFSSQPTRAKRRKRTQLDVCESLEARSLLAGDLVGHWRAADLVGTVAEGAAVTAWVDNVSGISASGFGTPTLSETGLGGRPTLLFDSSDGDDYLTVTSNDNPLTNADDFSVVVAFSTDSDGLVGGNGNWFENTGLIDSNSNGFGTDWGLSINANGQVSAGMGGGLGVAPQTIYSQAAQLNDGQLHVVAVTRAGGTMSVYVDDLAPVVQTGMSTQPRGRLDLTIGRLLGGTKLPFTGKLAELRVFNGALDGTETANVVDTLQSYYGNSAPVPADDSYTTDEDNTFFLISAPGVLGNDVDADGDTLTAQLVDQPAHGKVSLQSTGGFLFTPEKDFNGETSFTYRAFDFRGSDRLGTVTITVLPKYDPAVPVADSYKLLPSQSLTISAAEGVLVNDTNVDLAPLTAVLQDDVSNGQLTLNADGSFTYNSQGFSGTATFSYKINDQTQLSSAATVTLIVNTPPAPNDDTYTLDEDTPLVTSTRAAGVVGNDVDADGNVLTATLEIGPEHGGVSLNEDGTFTYVPLDNYNGPDSFTYRVTDGVDEAGPVTVNLMVTPVNDPAIGGSDSYFLLPDSTLDVSAANGLLRNDRDIESDALTAKLVTAATHGAVTVNADGSFSYAPEAGYIGVDRFQYVANDGTNDSAPIDVSISVLSKPLEISEFMASNADTLTTIVRADEAAEFVGEELSPDWIELRNYVDAPIDLGGMHLTDDAAEPMKWTFPAGTTLPASGYLVVFASGLDITNPALDQKGYLHTNFQLSPNGEYLAVTALDGDVLHDFGTSYPAQRTHVTFGVDTDGNELFFATPTPGTANGAGAQGLVESTTFSVEHGFFQTAFDVELSTVTDGASIRYTTDGTIPTETTGTEYTAP